MSPSVARKVLSMGLDTDVPRPPSPDHHAEEKREEQSGTPKEEEANEVLCPLRDVFPRFYHPYGFEIKDAEKVTPS